MIPDKDLFNMLSRGTPLEQRAANEIVWLRGSLEKMLVQLNGVPVKHPQQMEEREQARALTTGERRD